MLRDCLFDWQKNIVDSVNRNDYGLYLDMGLGKTPVSLALAEKHKCTKILVIAPNNKVLEDESVGGSWLFWSKKLEYKYNYSIKKQTSFSELQNDFYIINYESLYSRKKDRKTTVVLNDFINDFIKSCKDHNVAVIIDECHKMKDQSSIQTKAINKIKNNLKLYAKNLYCYLLSGTPFTTGYIDLYSQLKFLGYESNKETFKDRYCVMGHIPGLLGWQQPIVGYKNIDKLYETLHKYAITIKSETVQNLPEQIFVEHKLPKTKDFDLLTNETLPGKEIFKEIKKREGIEEREYNIDKKINNPFYRDIDFSIQNGSGKWFADTTGSFWMRARQLSIGFNGNAEESKWYNNARLNELKDFLANNEDNYVLFYNYTPELLGLYEICEELKYNVDVYCGEIKSLNFYDIYSKQDEDKRVTNKKNIILANFASGSEGKNWQAYNKCILFSIPVYKDWAQSLKRVHRTGQTKTVFYHIFYQDNWLDREMYKSLRQQINYSQKMFESDLNRVEKIMKEN